MKVRGLFVGLTAMALIGGIMFMVSCTFSPQQKEPLQSTPESIVHSSPQPMRETAPSSPPTAEGKNVAALAEWDSAHAFPDDTQLNISIDELYEQFDREIVSSTLDGGYSVDIERVNRDYVSENGVIIATFYFEKPILLGEDEVAERVNNIFDKEATGFFFGDETSAHYSWGGFDRFDYYVTRHRIYFGDAIMEESAKSFEAEQLEVQFRSSVKTSITYLGETTLSTMQDLYWMTIGVINTRHYGLTFDLRTGELLPINHFVGNDLEHFKQRVEETLYQNVDEYGENWVESFLTEQADFSFSDYEYYYDGTHVFLIAYNPNYYAYDYLVQLL